MRSAWLAALTLASACLEPQFVDCGEFICPVGSTCLPNGRCSCIGVCNTLCGDSIAEGDELCDDGNRDDGDGCSHDCASNETCGNGVVDFAVGETCDDGSAGASGDGCSSRCTLETELWRTLDDSPISPRFGARIAFDEDRGVTVLFGGGDESELAVSNETWEWNGRAWSRRASLHTPPARLDAAMAYDPMRRVTVLVGGRTAFGVLDDQWEWDGVDWRELTVTDHPSGRSRAGLSYAGHGRLLLFGGFDAAGSGLRSDESWLWDGTAWTLLPDAGPPGRAGSALAYDAVRDRVAMFGGAAVPPGGLLLDTWEFDGATTTWSKIVTTGTTPTSRTDHALAYDTVRRDVVMFGGNADPNVWRWNGAARAWTDTGNFSPRARHDHALAFDTIRGALVMFGGIEYPGLTVGDTWRYDVAWADVTPPSLRALTDVAMAYDPGRGRVVMHGGTIVLSSFAPGNLVTDGTWELVDGKWQRVADGTRIAGASLAYDVVGKTLLRVGGETSLPPSSIFDTRTERWDGVQWATVTVPMSPAGRAFAGMARGPDDTIVLFGGRRDGFVITLLDDTWIWNGASWADVSPSHSPPARPFVALAFDEARDVTVLFATDGNTGEPITWEWDGAAWNDRAPVTNPGHRSNFALGYDPIRKRVVLFGGRIGSTTKRDTWEWDGVAGVWSERPIVVPPNPHVDHAMAYDVVGRRMIAFGGATTTETIAHAFESLADPPELCFDAAADTDDDGLVGCADLDCAGRCSTCGDATCEPVEDRLICPADCP